MWGSFITLLTAKFAAPAGDRSQHCLTTRKYLVRGDGSTAHEGIFDLQTGEFLRQSTQQGWQRRFLLGARPGVGVVRLQARLRLQRRSALPCHGGDVRAFLYGAHPAAWHPPNDWDEPWPKPLFRESSAAAVAAGDSSTWLGWWRTSSPRICITPMQNVSSIPC